MDPSALPSPDSSQSRQPVREQAHTGEDAGGSQQGAYVVGNEIGQGAGSTNTSPEVTGSDASIVVGENAGVVGDSDAMTAGDTGDPRPDDSAARDP